MLEIPYTASKFPKHWGSDLSGNHTLQVSWEEMVWAAMTMGKPGLAFLFSNGWHSISDLIVRCHTVYANLQEKSPYFERSDLYREIDQTEKSSVSYFMGMLAAKILGARLLDTPWLFHLSMVAALGGTTILKAKSQPDLVGLRGNRDWIVVEAKGRTWGHSNSAMLSAKLQTRQLRRINGQYPSLRVAVQASFDPHLQWAIEDPPEIDDSASDINFNVEDALEMYYSATTAATDLGMDRKIQDRVFIVGEIPEIGVTIGLDRKLRDQLRNRSVTSGSSRLAPQRMSEHGKAGMFHLFPDGLAISLDERWSSERMSESPRSRRVD